MERIVPKSSVHPTAEGGYCYYIISTYVFVAFNLVFSVINASNEEKAVMNVVAGKCGSPGPSIVKTQDTSYTRTMYKQVVVCYQMFIYVNNTRTWWLSIQTVHVSQVKSSCMFIKFKWKKIQSNIFLVNLHKNNIVTFGVTLKRGFLSARACIAQYSRSERIYFVDNSDIDGTRKRALLT